MSHPHSLTPPRPNKSMLQGHFSSPCSFEINIKRNDIRCSLWVMAQSGPEKPVRRSIVGWILPCEVSWWVGGGSGQWSVSCTWVLRPVPPVGKGCRRSPAICSVSFPGLGMPSGLCACGSTPWPGRGCYWGRGDLWTGSKRGQTCSKGGLATRMALPWSWSQRLVDVFSQQLWGCWALKSPLRLLRLAFRSGN